MNQTILGRYMPFDSVIHRMDARCKIVAMIFLMVPIFLSFPNPPTSFIMYGIIAILIYILMLISHVKLRMILKQLKSLWFMMTFVLILNLLIVKDPKYGFIQIGSGNFILTLKAVYDTLYIILRLGLMVALTTILTSTTRPLDLTFALEWYLKPLKVIRFPTAEIAMTISLALRFIPTFLDDTERLMKAQESRGVSFTHGKLWEKVKAMVSLIIPLLGAALQKSEELANALEARGYDPSAKRTHYRVMKWHCRDTFALLFSAIFLGGMITLCVLRIDLIAWIGGWFA